MFWCDGAGDDHCRVGVRPGAAQTTELRFNWWVPGAHLMRTQIAEPWIRSVAEATQGRVKISLTATSLAPPPRQFDMIMDGIADIAVAAHSYNPDRFILPQGAELPLVSISGTATSMALWQAHERYFAVKDEYRGVKLLGLFAHGPTGIWTRGAPIRRMDELKGLKIRSGGGTSDEVVKLLGAVVVSSPAPTTYEILSRGVADATIFDPNAIPAFKLETIVKSYLEVPGGLYSGSFYYIMNSAKWTALSKADQDAIMKVSGEALARLGGGAWDAADKAALEQFDKLGLSRTRADGDLMNAIRATLKPIEDKYVADVKDKRGLDGAEIMKFLRDAASAQKS